LTAPRCWWAIRRRSPSILQVAGAIPASAACCLQTRWPPPPSEHQLFRLDTATTTADQPDGSWRFDVPRRLRAHNITTFVERPTSLSPWRRSNEMFRPFSTRQPLRHSTPCRPVMHRMQYAIWFDGVAGRDQYGRRGSGRRDRGFALPVTTESAVVAITDLNEQAHTFAPTSTNAGWAAPP